ncbi:MAG: PleD family two-component system response regulator [Pseudanabaena sp. M57BS1SP1A06MG]|nr:PleD family two-component system response regulator [Pseudanabaena sp. M53BS1SP1A06MG]MCA6581788.1 PleD family two-component system response regulator [Pseudanabaena sp. M34BS1SP1A06MG]MCA6591924.1 PleD family two-component system response regulator [Pseudanabaena sp. M38BS1SP1A06MG]MCA6600513.1 PleD family two-component system response regulator [Pseudanabaena sp. M57BS1SP1A06MG]
MTTEDRDNNKHPPQEEIISEITASEPALILIVDDDIFMRKILVRYLERENYRVVEAANGLEALKLFQEYQPDLILLDAVMPVLDGFECCLRLQKLPQGDHTPILIITALENRESVDRAYEVGASDYVAKPIHWAVLRHRVRRLLEQANLRQKLESANRRLAVVIKELQRLVSIDGLTQVANRRCLDEYLEQEFKRSCREKIPISLVLCDIDFFKKYNDNYGHQEGDLCLQAVAQSISKATNRPADLVARYGGEEFVIVLPNTDQEGGMNIAVKATELVRSLQIPHDYSEVAPYVTISCGVATLFPHQHTQAINLLLKSADRALYVAKAEGRNCVRQSDLGND